MVFSEGPQGQPRLDNDHAQRSGLFSPPRRHVLPWPAAGPWGRGRHDSGGRREEPRLAARLDGDRSFHCAGPRTSAGGPALGGCGSRCLEGPSLNKLGAARGPGAGPQLRTRPGARRPGRLLTGHPCPPPCPRHLPLPGTPLLCLPPPPQAPLCGEGAVVASSPITGRDRWEQLPERGCSKAPFWKCPS